MTLPETFELSTGDGRILRYCLYGDAAGPPVIFQVGTPSTRWRRPSKIKTRLLVYDRPGYGGSTRQPGRTVASAADDVRALADAQGWDSFGVMGGSGGGPHALACAALLAGRVTRCAVISGAKPGTSLSSRERLAEVAAEILAKIDAGGPEMPGVPGPPALTDPDAMARIRATFVDGLDGWADDSAALAQPWGFDPAKITVPVGLWHGTHDANLPPEHSQWLLANIPTAQEHVYEGGHVPTPEVFDRIHDWLSAR